MSEISVRPALATDRDGIAALLGEVDKFYGDDAPESPETRVRQISEVLGNQDAGGVQVIVAQDHAGLLAGFASFSNLWPAAGSTSSLYLKELYVQESYRSIGVGRVLMQHLIEIARDRGFSRVEWTTDTSNQDAQGFYEKLGFSPRSGKLFYRAEL
ncbi:GNAT family N-acetyltransferase [Actinokineospora inagensis]|uniref:GNAT family N-acetyltransferase n=1 Tax=Actinokineospora inagensis TaxID=103730 RepID=UPI0012F7FBCA|nr:GNAT family N-acetyltransferase [Actinokineospora inagensis]